MKRASCKSTDVALSPDVESPEQNVCWLPLCRGTHGDQFFRIIRLLHALIERLHVVQFQEDAVESGHYAFDSLGEFSF